MPFAADVEGAAAAAATVAGLGGATGPEEPCDAASGVSAARGVWGDERLRERAIVAEDGVSDGCCNGERD